ncbi:MAG TPA: hypothetical protein VF789_34020 [Thermoanaerobaculia bacterium]
MSRKAIRSLREEEPDSNPGTSEEPAEDPKTLRRKQLEEALSHQNKFELDLDQESLAKLRWMQ